MYLKLYFNGTIECGYYQNIILNTVLKLFGMINSTIKSKNNISLFLPLPISKQS